jgi:hypothetical protein
LCCHGHHDSFTKIIFYQYRTTTFELHKRVTLSELS